MQFGFWTLSSVWIPEPRCRETASSCLLPLRRPRKNSPPPPPTPAVAPPKKYLLFARYFLRSGGHASGGSQPRTKILWKTPKPSELGSSTLQEDQVCGIWLEGREREEMASWEGESEVVRRMSRIAGHVAGNEEVPAPHHHQLFPMNCSNTLNSVIRRCDNSLLFARQSSASHACFMRQVSVTQGLKVGGVQQNSPSSSSCSRNGSSCYESCGEPLFCRPAQVISYMPTSKNQQPMPQECVESSTEPPRFGRPSSGVCEKKQLSCNGTGQNVSSGGRQWSPRMDVAETGRCYVVMLELPGANVIDIKVEVDDKNLTVKGKHSAPWSRMEICSEKSKMTYIRREIFQGPYSVVWPLPNDVNKDSVSAELLNGFLHITLPKVCCGKVDAKM